MANKLITKLSLEKIPPSKKELQNDLDSAREAIRSLNDRYNEVCTLLDAKTKKLDRFEPAVLAEARVKTLVDEAVAAEMDKLLGPYWEKQKHLNEILHRAASQMLSDAAEKTARTPSRR